MVKSRAYDAGMRVFALLFALLPLSGLGQDSLQSKIAVIAKDAKGTVSVSCMLAGTKLNCDLNPHNHPPMQSMYKLPLALTALHLAEMGKLLPNQRTGDPIDVTLDRTVRFLPSDIIPGSYSPLTDRYPKANVDLTLREVVRMAVAQSDNGAEEVLIRLVGGPSVVESYIHSLGIPAFHLLYSERDLDRDENLQYQDWIEPAAAVQLLERLVSNPPISPAANVFLLETMTGALTGPRRLRAGLPPDTVLAHKTGSSGTHGGITAATNDIGLISLPDGRKLAIAVFVTDSRADERTREGVIARIARAAYKEALVTR
jgi:beta-lactamase class A